MQNMQAGEIHIGPIHDVDGTRLRKQHIECVDIVQFAVGNVDEAWNIAAQVKQRVHLHRGFGRTEMCPWKHRQTQIYGGRVECIDGAGQIDVQIIIGVPPYWPSRSAAGQTRRRFVNRGFRWHQPMWNGEPVLANPYDKAWPIALTDTPRCRASSPDR